MIPHSELVGFLLFAFMECDRIDAEKDYAALEVLLVDLHKFHHDVPEVARHQALREANNIYGR